MPPEGSTPQLRPLDPRVRTLWWLSGGLIAAAAVTAVAVASLIGPLHDLRPWPLLAVFVAATTAAVTVPQLRYRRWRYAVSDEQLEIRRGVLWTTVSVIPFSR